MKASAQPVVTCAGADPLHPGTTAAACLVAAAVVDRLHEVEGAAVLRALRQMQVTDGGNRHGCLKWYWEEPRPVDTNAAFFTGLNLIVLRLGFPDQVEQWDPETRETLDAILAGVREKVSGTFFCTTPSGLFR